MRYLVAFFLASLLLAGCGSGVDSATPGEQAAELRPFLDRFIREADARGVDTRGWESLPLVFLEELDGETPEAVAECYRPAIGRREVHVRPSFWNDAKRTTDVVREQVMLHELGHCLLGRAHDDRRLDTYRPCSLMNRKANSPFYFGSHRAAYMDEMFEGGCATDGL